MADRMIGQPIIAFCNTFRYSGILLEEDDSTYLVDDEKDGLTKLPKASTVVRLQK